MSRPRKFSRDGVLDKAIPVFWRLGLAGTNVQLLERVTGVNKSGLYAEFASKEDLFVAALRRYLETGPALTILGREPLGWDNIAAFLLQAPLTLPEQAGCFSINSTREAADLPPRALDAIRDFNRLRLERLTANIRMAAPGADAPALADMVMTFFAGICIDANLGLDPAAHQARVDRFMDLLRLAAARP